MHLPKLTNVLAEVPSDPKQSGVPTQANAVSYLVLLYIDIHKHRLKTKNAGF